jgi:hypothetical protein
MTELADLRTLALLLLDNRVQCPQLRLNFRKLFWSEIGLDSCNLLSRKLAVGWDISVFQAQALEKSTDEWKIAEKRATGGRG